MPKTTCLLTCAVACLIGQLVVCRPTCAATDKLPALQKQFDAATRMQQEERYASSERMLKKVIAAIEKIMPGTDRTAERASPESKDAIANTDNQAPPVDPYRAPLAKLEHDAYMALAQTYWKQQKFVEAESCYNKAIELENRDGLEPQARGKLQELKEVYRSVSIDSLGEKAADVAKDAGITNAFAVRKGDSDQININLGSRYRKRIDEERTEGKSNNGGNNQLKQIRIDPKLSFHVAKQSDGIKISNIEGLAVDVGLWVKLMEVQLLNTEEGPRARVTGGKFGVSKTVDIGVPENLYQQVRSSIEKLDPFFNAMQAVITPGGTRSEADMPSP